MKSKAQIVDLIRSIYSVGTLSEGKLRSAKRDQTQRETYE